jgi:hypothetical protein
MSRPLPATAAAPVRSKSFGGGELSFAMHVDGLCKLASSPSNADMMSAAALFCETANSNDERKTGELCRRALPAIFSLLRSEESSVHTNVLQTLAILARDGSSC